MKIINGSRQLAVTSLAVLVVLLISLSWALADISPSLEEWNRTLGGSQADGGFSVQETSDGGYIIAGYTMSFGSGQRDVYLVKTDSQGRETWSTTFGGSQADGGFSVQETSDGGYIIAGSTMSFGLGSSDVYLVKTDSQGMETWSTTFGGSQADGGYSVQETSDGGYIISGVTASSGAGGTDVYLVKTDSQGMETWSTTFGGSQDDLGYSIQETSDGGYIISGYTMSVGAGGHDVYLVKVDSQGRETWSTAFGGSGHDFGWSVREISDGGYIIAGHTMSFGAGEGDVFLVKADSQGMETWSTTFGGAQDDCGYSVQAASDGGYIIVGYTMSLGAGGSDVYLLKVDQGGVEERYSASLVDLEAPSEVYAGASFTVELTVSYEFTFPTEMNAGINDVETETWITGEPEVFEGEGTKIYSFELTAPEVETT